MNKTTTFSIIVVLISMVTILFVMKTNNHLECDSKTEITHKTNGDKIVIEVHICKEKYNL